MRISRFFFVSTEILTPNLQKFPILHLAVTVLPQHPGSLGTAQTRITLAAHQRQLRLRDSHKRTLARSSNVAVLWVGNVFCAVVFKCSALIFGVL